MEFGNIDIMFLMSLDTLLKYDLSLRSIHSILVDIRALNLREVGARP